MLLAADADANATNAAARDPCEEALRGGHDEVVALLEGWGEDGREDGGGGEVEVDGVRGERPSEGGGDAVEQVSRDVEGMRVGDGVRNGT